MQLLISIALLACAISPAAALKLALKQDVLVLSPACNAAVGDAIVYPLGALGADVGVAAGVPIDPALWGVNITFDGASLRSSAAGDGGFTFGFASEAATPQQYSQASVSGPPGTADADVSWVTSCCAHGDPGCPPGPQCRYMCTRAGAFITRAAVMDARAMHISLSGALATDHVAACIRSIPLRLQPMAAGRLEGGVLPLLRSGSVVLRAAALPETAVAKASADLHSATLPSGACDPEALVLLAAALDAEARGLPPPRASPTPSQTATPSVTPLDPSLRGASVDEPPGTSIGTTIVTAFVGCALTLVFAAVTVYSIKRLIARPTIEEFT